MAVLTSTGIIFGSGGGTLDSKYGIIPQSTPMVFIRSAAPTGWTQVTTQNDKALRVVNNTTSGGTAAGTNTFSGTFASRPVSANVPVSISGLAAGGTTLSVNTVPQHAHPLNSGGNVGAGGASPASGSQGGTAPGTSTGNYGNSGSHAHPVTFSSANGPGATNLDFRVQYVDVIICTLN
jgi:hypothetical protein